MLESVRDRISQYLALRSSDDFPADFSFIDSDVENKNISYKFVTELDYPVDGGVLLDENVAFDMVDNRNRVVDAYLDDDEAADVMSILGHRPERDNLTESGQYRYHEEFDSSDIEDMLKAAYKQDVDLFYVEQVDDIMRKNNVEEETVQRYMEELDKIAEPLTVEPLQDNVPMDVAIALKAEQENLNIVTSDVDFIDQPFLGMESIENSVYTPKQMKQLLETEKGRSKHGPAQI